MLRDFLLVLGVVTLALLALFYRSLDSNLVLFSNDAPLGLISAESAKEANTFRGLFTGYWHDLNWLGIEQSVVLPSSSWFLYQVLFRDPVVNAKFYAPVALLCLGLSAWLFCRQLGFRNSVGVLVGLAAALNMNVFSNACWGLPTRALTQSLIFLALAAVQSGTRRYFWIKAALAGMAVGWAVTEGFDVGALYSLFVAAFAVFLVLASNEKATAQTVGKGIALVAVIAICAGWLAAHALNTLIATQIKGVVGMQQDESTKQKRWDEATQWSLPKIETARVLVPGLFGYRMDAGPGRYWGAVGQSPGVPYTRHSGSGEYAGVLVVLVAGWGLASGLRKQGGSLTLLEKRYVKFWSIAALIALLLAWGRHAPFYKIIYSLPYFSTIRNPIKFMHIFHFCLLIVFAFGLEEIFRSRIVQAKAKYLGLTEQLRTWWKTIAGAEKRWALGAAGFGIFSLLVTFIYLSSGRELTGYLRTAGFSAEEIPSVLKFSTNELWMYLAFYGVSLFVLAVILSGWLAGTRWKVAVGLLGAVLFIDLARANEPWIQYYNYKDRFSSNPALDLLKQSEQGQRATFKVSPFSNDARMIMVNLQQKELQWWPDLYSVWLQNQFQYLNVFSLEPIQFAGGHIPELDLNYVQNFFPRSTNDYYVFSRMWELTATRFGIGQNGYSDVLNQNFDAGRNRFRNFATFNFVPKNSSTQTGGVSLDELTTQIATNGGFSLIEFAGALPRAKLFTTWETLPTDEATLKTLREASFDPAQKVLLAPDSPDLPTPSRAATNGTAKAELANYHAKWFDVQTEASAPGVLLVNDKFSPNWKVWVDGKPEPLLRCNYIMRGVFVPGGSHKVEFKYRPPMNSLYVTLSAMGVGVLLLGFLAARSLKTG